MEYDYGRKRNEVINTLLLYLEKRWGEKLTRI
jgi:hypothetical protein